MRTKKILSLILFVVFIFSFSVTAFAENKNTILNNAFYIDMPDDFEDYSYYYTDTFNFSSEDATKEIYISLEENTYIGNMEADFKTSKALFGKALYEATYYSFEETKLTKEKVSLVNRCKVAEFCGTQVYEEEGYDTYAQYVKGYVFATKEHIYYIVGLNYENDNFRWFDNIVSTFRMNGTLLAGDNQKNDVNFAGAIDYKEQLENYSSEYDSFESEDFGLIFTVVAVIFVIPLFIVLAIGAVFVIKYIRNKKILTQYEKTFGIINTTNNIYDIDYNLIQTNPEQNNQTNNYNL